MAGLRPFLLYRYQMEIEGEELNSRAQLVALKELQGQFLPSGNKAAIEGRFDTVLMRPRSFHDDEETQVFTWSVGTTNKVRIRVDYNKADDDIDRKLLADGGLRYSDFVAIPALGIMAVDDRSGEEFLGGSNAAHRFKSIFRHSGTTGDRDVQIVPAADYADVQNALKRWSITTFSFTIKPYNPHAPTALARELGERLKERQVKRAHGEWQAEQDKGLKPDDDMSAIVELSEAGYGQIAIKGRTPKGQQVEIKKSAFSEDKDKNLKSLEKPRQMRILVDTEGLSDRKVQKIISAIITELHGD